MDVTFVLPAAARRRSLGRQCEEEDLIDELEREWRRHMDLEGVEAARRAKAGKKASRKWVKDKK